MSYFQDLEELPDYARDDFHFDYNHNTGGGQSDLAGKFIDAKGQPTPLVTLEGKNAVFKYCFKTAIQGEKAVILKDDQVIYPIKRRSEGSTGMRLLVEGKQNPSKALTAFFMLPDGCTVRRSISPSDTVAVKGNYWLQTMKLEYEEDASQPNNAYLIPSSFVFGVGDKDTQRHFSLDSDRRIRDIIAVSKRRFLPDAIREQLCLFADMYVGKRSFTVEEAKQTIATLMQEVAERYPALYSGTADPLPVLMELTPAIRFRTGLGIPGMRNLVIFGAPGTGKSKLLDQKKGELLERGGEFERVTFHPDYSYANFVGTYKPVPTKDSEGKETITYKYVAGPFMRVLAAALRNGTTRTVKPHVLLIEEINRACATAVFGDIFQLLDRNRFNVSEYSIHPSSDVQNYLAETVGGPQSDYEELWLPDNMFIWGSMNSADQGVFPMDTAFKRRWNFIYIGIDDNDTDLVGKFVTLGKGRSEHTIEWNALRKSINTFLAEKGINEDKQIGPYFLSREVSVPDKGDQIEREPFVDAFQQKVLMYLFEDAARLHRQTLFKGCKRNRNRYSDIRSEFESVGMYIFDPEIFGRVPTTNTSAAVEQNDASVLGTDQE
jgi:hypothetical protein